MGRHCDDLVGVDSTREMLLNVVKKDGLHGVFVRGVQDERRFTTWGRLVLFSERALGEESEGEGGDLPRLQCLLGIRRRNARQQVAGLALWRSGGCSGTDDRIYQSPTPR